MDLVRPKSEATRKSESFAIVFRDGFSRYSRMYPIASNQDAPHARECFLAGTGWEGDVKVMHTGNGSDFEREFGSILDRKRSKREYVPLG